METVITDRVLIHGPALQRRLGGMRREQIRAYARAGELPVFELGKKLVSDQGVLNDFLERKSAGALRKQTAE